MKDLNTIISGMRKVGSRGGGIANDMVGAAVGGIVPGVNLIGTGIGLYHGRPTEGDLEKMDQTPEYSYIPGVGAYRLMRKSMDAVGTPDARKKIVSEGFGGLTSTALLAASLAGVGGILGGSQGAATGAWAGYGLGMGANALGAVIGAARKRMTQKEQEEADKNENNTANWLVPGAAAYHMSRRSHSITRREDARNAKDEEKSKQKKKASISVDEMGDTVANSTRRAAEKAKSMFGGKGREAAEQAWSIMSNPGYRDAIAGVIGGGTTYKLLDPHIKSGSTKLLLSLLAGIGSAAGRKPLEDAIMKGLGKLNIGV